MYDADPAKARVNGAFAGKPHFESDQKVKRTPSCNCLGPPKRAVDGALVGSSARTFGKKPVGQVTLSGFAVSARAALPVQKLLMESTPKPLFVFLVTLKTSADRSSFFVSPKRKAFRSLRSILKNRGMRNVLRPTTVPPITARSFASLRSVLKSSPSVITAVNGNPVRATMIVLIENPRPRS